MDGSADEHHFELIMKDLVGFKYSDDAAGKGWTDSIQKWAWSTPISFSRWSKV
jgi:hypothetical protein